MHKGTLPLIDVALDASSDKSVKFASRNGEFCEIRAHQADRHIHWYLWILDASSGKSVKFASGNGEFCEIRALEADGDAE